MSSIRPLITITILFAFGAFMFTKINEGPAPTIPGGAAIAENPAVNVPPLASVPGPAATASDEGAADQQNPLTPQWTNEPANSIAANNDSPTTTPAPQSLEPAAIPAVPELPPMPAMPGVAAIPIPTGEATRSIEIPASVPTARYPDTPATPNDSVAVAPAAQPIMPSVPEVPIAAPTSDERYGATDAVPQSAVSQSAAPKSEVQQRATSQASAEPSFAADWPEIQGALERQELVQAHEKLSHWYGNPMLSPTEAQQVESLLGQLAGTVVYSTEHRLEPPYTVQAGDTLQSIAQKYEVPWQLLAKINGVPAVDMVQPGQQLKVVNGPFSAVVEIEEQQLTLMLDGRYAGRFPISVEPTAIEAQGEWVLEQKLVNPTAEESGVVSASYAMPATVDRVLVLRNESSGDKTISITSGQTPAAGPTAVAPPAARLSSTDAEEVADILSVGSRVTFRK